MNRFLALLLLLFFSSQSFGQTRLTEFVGEGSALRYILKEVDEVNYILTINQSDLLQVYRLDAGEPEFLHDRSYPGMQTETYLQTTTSHVLWSDSQGSITYDFVNDVETKYPYEPGFNLTYWRAIRNDQVVMRQTETSFTNYKQLHLDLSTGEQVPVLPELSTFTQTEDWIYAVSYQDDYDHMLINKDTWEMDTMHFNHLYARQYALDDFGYYYVQDSAVFRYDIATGAKQELYVADYDHHHIELQITEEELLINVLMNSWDANLLVMDKTDFTYDLIALEHKPDFIHPKIINGCLIYLINSDLYVHKLSDGTIVGQYSRADDLDDFLVIEDRYLLFHQGYRLEMVDLNTLDYKIVLDNKINGSLYQASALEHGSKYLLYFDTGSQVSDAFFEFDPFNQSATLSDAIPPPPIGLPGSAKVIKTGSDMLLYNEDFFLIHEDGSLSQLNEETIDEAGWQPFKRLDDDFYWMEESAAEVAIYRLSQGEKFKLASIPNSGQPPTFDLVIYDYFVAGEDIYYWTNGFGDRNIYKYEGDDGSISLIEECLSPSFVYFGNQEEYTYFINDELKIIQPDESIESMSLVLPFAITDPFTNFKDQIYILGSGGLYALDGMNAILTIPDASEFNLRNIGPYLQFEDATGQDHLYDGSDWATIPMSETYFPRYSGNDIFQLVKGTGTNQTLTKIYDHSSQQVIELPEEIATQKIQAIIERDGFKALIGRTGFPPNSIFSVYERDAEFTTFNKILEQVSVHYNWDAKFEPSGNEGLFYIGADLFLLDELKEFVPLNTIDGFANVAHVEQRGDYFYFLALDPIFGLQLFRIAPISLWDSVNELQGWKPLTLFPNPAQDWLYFSLPEEEALDGDQDFLIYDVKGTLIKSGTTPNSALDVSALGSGTYFLVLANRYSAAFQVAAGN